MSTFISPAVNPKTNQPQIAFFIDDFYGHHQYAVAFRKDGTDSEITDELRLEEYDFYRPEEITAVADETE